MKDLEQQIKEAAHKHYPYGHVCGVGSSMRALYEEKKESFLSGALSPEAKEYWQKEMYSGEEMKEMIYLYLASNTFFKVQDKIGLPTYISEWFEQNKKQ